MKDDKPVLGLCDVRILIYKSIGLTIVCFYNKLSIVVVSNLKQALITLGTFEISTISMSSVLINPQFQKSTDLAENKYFIVTPSKEMIRTIDVPLVYIMDALLADSQDCLYKFKATIVDILNKDEPWYSSCKKRSKKVKVIEHTESCNNCNSENVEYEMRYCLRLEVCGGEQRAQVILFEEAKYLLGYSFSFERKCTHHAAEKTGPLKWLMKWDIVDLLVLKENASIMLLRKLDPANGLCNGTWLICRGFDKNAIHAEKATCQYATNQ
ncbi:hypothetical protein H5410_046487, partial [Solanum commersonii]